MLQNNRKLIERFRGFGISLLLCKGVNIIATRKRSKYGVDQTKKGIEKRTYNGEVYDSLAELQFLKEVIEVKMGSGEITKWERQVKFTLQEGFTYKGKKVLPINYIADYVIYLPNNGRVIIDVKGNPDQVSKLKKKMMMYKYPNENYIWVCRSIKYSSNKDMPWLLYEDLEKKRKENKKKKGK